MIWSFITTCCFATLAAIIYNAITEVYRWTSVDYINRKKLLKKIDDLIIEENDRLNNPNVYPSMKQSALSRVNNLIYIKEIIKSMR